MKKLAAVFVVATLLLNAMAPTLAYAATYLQGAEVNADTLIQDAYVAVTYYDSKNKQKLEKGWIDAIDETTFRIRSGALFGKKTIAYDKVLSVIMGEEATPRGKQINKVDRFIQEMEKGEARALETDQAAIQRLNQKTVTVMPRGQIDPSKITKGWYAHIVYTSQGVRGTAMSRIADKDSSHIALQYGLDTSNIAYDDIDTLIVAKHMRDIESYRETGAKYNARVRVHGPSIQKGQMVGKLIKMMQDTLVIQKGRSFYQVPVSSISKLDVSIKQYRNTGKGLIIGFGAGLVIFTVSYAYVKKLESRNPDNIDGLAVFIFGIIAAPSAFVISTLIGAITKSDKWVEVSPQRLNLSLAPVSACRFSAHLPAVAQAGVGTSAKGLRAALTFNF